MIKTPMIDSQRTLIKEARIKLCMVQELSVSVSHEGVGTGLGNPVNRELYDKVGEIISEIEHLLGY